VELGNWPIKVQLGSTNSKGLPVLHQGSHQGFLLNNQLIHYDGSNGHAHCHPFTCLQVSQIQIQIQIQRDAKPRLHPHPNNQPAASTIPPSMPATSLRATVIQPECPSSSTNMLPPSTARRRAGCHLILQLVEPNQLTESIIRWVGPSCQPRNTGSASAQHPHGWLPPSMYKGPCTGVEAKRRIKSMVLPWIDGSLILEF